MCICSTSWSYKYYIHKFPFFSYLYSLAICFNIRCLVVTQECLSQMEPYPSIISFKKFYFFSLTISCILRNRSASHSGQTVLVRTCSDRTTAFLIKNLICKWMCSKCTVLSFNKVRSEIMYFARLLDRSRCFRRECSEGEASSFFFGSTSRQTIHSIIYVLLLFLNQKRKKIKFIFR